MRGVNTRLPRPSGDGLLSRVGREAGWRVRLISYLSRSIAQMSRPGRAGAAPGTVVVLAQLQCYGIRQT